LGEREIPTHSIKTGGFAALRSTHFPDRFKGAEAINKSLQRPFGRKTWDETMDVLHWGTADSVGQRQKPVLHVTLKARKTE
jgi:hypothetical protein